MRTQEYSDAHAHTYVYIYLKMKIVCQPILLFVLLRIYLLPN